MNWRYVGASVKGTSHIYSGLPCQDSSLILPVHVGDSEPILILTVSDGAGSAVRAEVGSNIACSTFAATMMSHIQGGGAVRNLSADMVKERIREVVERLKTYAYTGEVALKDLACTFLAAVVGQSETLCLQIGDGAIVVADGEEYRAVFWPQSGEYANTTHFLTDDNALDVLEVTMIERPVDEISLFSDGLQMLALQYAARQAHHPFFRSLFARLRSEEPGEAQSLTGQLTEWLESPAIISRTEDDKSLLLATRRAAL